MQPVVGVDALWGLVHGVAAGAGAGLVAGLVYAKCPSSCDSVLILQSIALSIPPGAAFGLVLSFCDPGATLSPAGRLAAITILGTGVMIPVGFLVVRTGLSLKGEFAEFLTVQLGVGAFTLLKAALHLLPLGRAPWVWARLVVLGALLFVSGWGLQSLPAFHGLEFSLASRAQTFEVGAALGLLPLWSGCFYLVVTADSSFTRALDRLAARPPGGA
jgi:hypothetical protein